MPVAHRLQRWLLSIFAAASLLFVLNVGVLSGSLCDRHRTPVRVDGVDLEAIAANLSRAARASGGAGVGADGVALQLLRTQLDQQTRSLREISASVEELTALQRSVTSAADVAIDRAQRASAQDTAAAAPVPEVAPAPSGHGRERAPFALCKGKRAVVIFCYNRPHYLERAMRSVLARMPTDGRYVLVVSQDGADPGVAAVVAAEGRGARPGVVHLQHPRTEVPVGKKENAGYYYLAAHYGWALSQVFHVMQADEAIILEDDIEVAEDFFAYFDALAPLVREDPTLLSVSAFSDNGQPEHTHDPSAVYRSDFFPGLGWLMTADLWRELGPKWPRAYWDDWLREPHNRRGRATLRPEMSRTYTYGEKGVSKGQFSAFLKSMALAPGGKADWAAVDRARWTKARYDGEWLRAVAAAREVRPADLAAARASGEACGDLRITYRDPREFELLAKALHLMTDIRAGVPRTAYLGVVVFRRGPCRVFLAPSYPVHADNQSIVHVG